MPSSRDRQRKLARAKVERQMARRAARARRRRQLTAGLSAAVVLLLVVLGTTWALGGFSHKPKKAANAATCTWKPADTTANKNLKDVGTPPTSGEQRTGTKTMTITTSQGVVTAQLDAAKAPCTVSSISYLAGRQFYNNTTCHRLTTSGIYVLQCGDPSGTGQGGPGYTMGTEYVPSTPDPSSSDASTVIYKAGTLAMANTGQPESTGSQFFIVYKDSPLKPTYTAIGTVTSGLDVVQKVAGAGAVDSKGKPTGDGTPKTKVVIQSMAVGTAAQAPASAAPTASPSPSAGANS